MKKYIILITALAVSLSVFSVFAAIDSDEVLSNSKTLIKIDSTGAKGRIMATGIGYPPDKSGMSGPQAKLLAKRAAVVVAYKELLSTIDGISLDFFPKERYLFKNGYIRGAQLLETRYYGDGSVEVDVGLDIALEGVLVERFEKDMQLSGYRVIECDSSRREITKEKWEELIGYNSRD